MERGGPRGDGHAVAEVDARFHGRIVELADNRTLERVWRALQPYSRTYISLFAQGADPTWSAHLHTPILAALAPRPDAVAGARATLRRGRGEHGRALAGDRATGSDRGAIVTDTLQLSEEFELPALRLRVDVLGSKPRDHLLEDMSFLNYRLAEVRPRLR